MSGQISAQPPYQVDLRPYLEGEVFGPLAPGGASDSIVRPHLRGRITSEEDGSSTLAFRIDQFATALATIILSGMALVLIVVGGCGYLFGGATWKPLGQVLALIGAIIGVWPLMFMTRISVMTRYEEFLIRWVTELGGTFG